MNLIKIGNSKLPPGSKNIANDGIVLQISSSCFFTFFFHHNSPFLDKFFWKTKNRVLKKMSSSIFARGKRGVNEG